MKIIRYNISKPGRPDYNLITKFDVDRLKKIKYEVVLFNMQDEPYRVIALVEAREIFVKDNMEDNPVETKKYIARRTIELLQKKGLNISSML